MSSAGDVTRAVTAELRGMTEDRFGRHAALQAIDARIADADNAVSILARHIGWLQDVKRRRKAEITAGTWPPQPEPLHEQEEGVAVSMEAAAWLALICNGCGGISDGPLDTPGTCECEHTPNGVPGYKVVPVARSSDLAAATRCSEDFRKALSDAESDVRALEIDAEGKPERRC